MLLVFAVSAQFPPGFNYNPYDYFPYTALQPPTQETTDEPAGRADHIAAANRFMPAFSASYPYVSQDAPEAYAGKMGE